jgi:hypothetical protein
MLPHEKQTPATRLEHRGEGGGSGAWLMVEREEMRKVRQVPLTGKSTKSQANDIALFFQRSKCSNRDERFTAALHRGKKLGCQKLHPSNNLTHYPKQ